MNRIVLIVIALALIVLLAVGAVFFFRPKSPPATTGNPSFPTGGTTGNTTGGGTTVESLSVKAQDGSGIPVKNFITDGKTIPDPSNTGAYYLTGADASEFAIKYDSQASAFTVALDAEPIGKARLDAEAYLEQALGISESQMCSLNYYVGTDEYTNSVYAGKNLGFSFCPGAVKLP